MERFFQHPAMLRCAHIAPWILAAMGVLVIITLVADDVPPLSDVSSWPAFIVGAAGGWFIVTLALSPHDSARCGICSQKSLNEHMRAVAKNRLLLYMRHCLAISICYASLMPCALIYWLATGRAEGLAVIVASAMLMCITIATHELLRRWCPYCSPGERYKAVLADK